MNKELLLETLQKEKKVRSQKREKRQDFSWILFFAGEEYNQELSNNQEIQKKINLIDFEKAENSAK